MSTVRFHSRLDNTIIWSTFAEKRSTKLFLGLNAAQKTVLGHYDHRTGSEHKNMCCWSNCCPHSTQAKSFTLKHFRIHFKRLSDLIVTLNRIIPRTVKLWKALEYRPIYGENPEELEGWWKIEWNRSGRKREGQIQVLYFACTRLIKIKFLLWKVWMKV